MPQTTSGCGFAWAPPLCFVNKSVAVLGTPHGHRRCRGVARPPPRAVRGSERSLLPRPRSAGEGRSPGTADPGGRRGPSSSAGRPGEGGAAAGAARVTPPRRWERAAAALSAGDGGRGLGVPGGGGCRRGAGWRAWEALGSAGTAVPQVRTASAVRVCQRRAAVEPGTAAASPGDPLRRTNPAAI